MNSVTWKLRDGKRRLVWYLRQLLPLTYRSHYSEVATGHQYVAVWNMFLGRVYNHEVHRVS